MLAQKQKCKIKLYRLNIDDLGGSLKSAPVSKIKGTLSQYLADVKAGEEVVVTERGKPIAKIVPISNRSLSDSDYLSDLARQGLARVGSGKLPEDFWRLPRPKDTRGKGLKALVKERMEER